MDAQNMTQGEIEILPQPTLEQLERQTTAFLYALWAAQKKDKKIVDLRQDNVGFEQRPFNRRKR